MINYFKNLTLQKYYSGFSFQIFLLNLTLAAIILSGCSLISEPAPTQTPTSPPASPPPSCLIGIWEIADPEIFLRSLLPVNAFEPAALEYINRVGSVAYRFDQQGNLTVEAVGLHGRFDVHEGDTLNMLDIRMNGFASATYQSDGEFIRTTGMISSDMQFFADFASEEMMPDAKANSFLPLFVVPYTSARFYCNTQTLELEFEDLPNISSPLIFNRLR